MIDREEKLYKIDGKARFDYEQKENENINDQTNF